ncbi:MAG TPA: acyl carrier protein [Dongiaceae bacterium]|nr:acyl carrier protein [Dongiaceae bacterium]
MGGVSDPALRQLVIDWLDDNYHFGEAEAVIGDDDRSFLRNGVLDSLGFVKLILFLETRLGLSLERKHLTPDNFDSLRKIVTHVSALPGYRGVPA